MTTVIKAENLSKKYIIRHKQDPYDKFADMLVKPFKYAGQKLVQPFTKEPVNFISPKEEFWALKDVSFEIKQGDRVGIIGRNGAGKSTLLKLISRITEPTMGKISLKGRVSSLLEVGTGFHQELTGRENIYLNGAVLGMTRREIKRKFDEIVAFAEVEKFLDTPVKRYSSGMYVRLAFAVAAHLEPEILIVDEVLAVGDTAFQKKCLGKMEEVGQEGRTVLFVSHNMGVVQTLCSVCMLLENGELVNQGETLCVVEDYLKASSACSTNSNLIFIPRLNHLGKLIKFSKCLLFNSKQNETLSLLYGEPFSIYLELESYAKNSNINLIVGFDSLSGERITTVTSKEDDKLFEISESDKLRVNVYFPTLVLTPGIYWIHLTIHINGERVDEVIKSVRFEVLEVTYGNRMPHSKTLGYLNLPSEWQLFNCDV